MLKRRPTIFCGVALLALAAAGCGGGGSHLAPSPPSVPASSSGSNGSSGSSPVNLTLSIKIPRGTLGPSSSKRSVQYISAGTQSITATLTPGGSGTSNCSGSLCSITIGATVGTPSLTVTLYDQPGGAAGGGHVLSTATQTVTIAANTANAVNLTFNGVVTQLAMQQGPVGDDTPPVYLQPGTFAVDVVPEDAQGYVVVSPGVLLDPTLMQFGTFTNGSAPNVTLGTTDSAFSSVSPVTYNSVTGYFESLLTYSGGTVPSQPIMLTLTGGSVGSGISLGTFSGANLTFTPQTLYYSAVTIPGNPNNINGYLDPGPDGYTTNAYTDSYIEVPQPAPSPGTSEQIGVTLSENYNANTALAVTSDTCSSSITDGSESTNLPSEYMGSPVSWTFNVTTISNGSCYFVVTDTQGNSAKLDIDVNQGSLFIEGHHRKASRK